VAKSVQDAIESGLAFSYVLVTTKYLPDIITTAQILQPLLSDSYVHPVLPTIVLMQNGLGIEEDIYAALKSYPKTLSSPMVISCAVYITASVLDDGSVIHGPFESMVIGVYRETEGSHVETNSPEEQRLLDNFAMLLRGSNVEIATNCLAARFFKNLWNATVGVISALSGHPWHSWILLPAAQSTAEDLFPPLLAEIIAVGRAIGLTEEWLPNNAGELTIQRSTELVKSGVKHIPSILLDVMNKRPIEVEGILGFLVKKGRAHNVAVPRSFTKSCPSYKSHSEVRHHRIHCEEFPVSKVVESLANDQ